MFEFLTSALTALFSLYAEGFSGCPMCLFVAAFMTAAPILIAVAVVDLTLGSWKHSREMKARALDASQKAAKFNALMKAEQDEKAAVVKAIMAANPSMSLFEARCEAIWGKTTA